MPTTCGCARRPRATKSSSTTSTPRAGNDVETQKLREMTAKGLATAALRKARETNLPVIITGDMNNYPTTMIEGVAGTPLTLTSKGFLDTYAMTENRTNGDFSTHCSQENVAEDGSLTVGRNGTKRIDYIYAYPYERAAASDYGIVIDFADDTHTSARVPMPSDHLPVRTTLLRY